MEFRGEEDIGLDLKKKKKKKTEAGTGSVLGICNGVVVGSRTWKEPLQDWSWMWSLCCGRRQSYSSSEERVRMETNIWRRLDLAKGCEVWPSLGMGTMWMLMK